MAESHFNLNQIMKVRVYRNLNKDCLSVQEKTEKGWRVKRWVDSIPLKNVIFKVYESGRNKVLKDKRKNVHAYIEGEDTTQSFQYNRIVSYNPYKYNHFYDVVTQSPVAKQNFAFVTTKGIFI